jgi:hypothetical protein
VVLVDTSIWVAHLRTGNAHMSALLHQGNVLSHPFIIGELACGRIRNRDEILSLLHALPQARTATDSEVLQFIQVHRLMGAGLGLVDVHLLASARLSSASLWTSDRRLGAAARRLGVRYEPPKED